MRIGIFGGTFDPVHYGHLVLAEQCREQLALDEVWLLPAGHPPHKPDAVISAGSLRAELVELAIAGHPRFKVDRRELRRAGPSYTVETLAEVRAEVPEAELFLLIGADSLFDLPHWKDPARIAELATIVAVNRPASPAMNLAPLRSHFSTGTLERIRFVTIPGCDISATDLRRRIREGRSVRYLLPPAVECLVRERGLYRDERTR